MNFIDTLFKRYLSAIAHEVVLPPELDECYNGKYIACHIPTIFKVNLNKRLPRISNIFSSGGNVILGE